MSKKNKGNNIKINEPIAGTPPVSTPVSEQAPTSVVTAISTIQPTPVITKQDTKKPITNRERARLMQASLKNS